MTRIAVFLAGAILICSPLHADSPGSETSTDWYANDVTKRLEDVIFDFRINLDQIRRQRRAIVAKGERFFRERDRIITQDVYYVAVHDSKDKTLFANSKTREANHGTLLLEQWDQVFLDGKNIYRRYSPYFADQKPQEIKDEDDKKKVFLNFVRFDPILLSVADAGFVSIRGPSKTADEALTNGVLDSAKYDADGNIVQEIVFPNSNVEFSIVFSKKHQFMPSVFSIWKRGKDKRRLTSQVETHWQSVGDLMFPSKQTFVKLGRVDRIESHELDIEVRIGEQLNGITLLDRKTSDWREPTRKLFNEHWQRAGVRPPVLIPENGEN
ncbi:MAG: hypothetical protein F9B45_06990 [Phycisphaera sp. RhM]|nr:hypothetical protein [Phycisphaera sp. RhM]